MKIGFTGTAKGMTDKQIRILQNQLLIFKPKEFHHGDCVGADADAHRIALALNILVVVHPPIDDKQRAFCGARGKRGPKVSFTELKPYLERNHDIVDACDVLIATPAQRNEVLRSGTWATIRYARKKGKEVIIINPEGRKENHDKLA
jgi:hypothetical protein